jgi:hypothetical protein
MLEQFENVRHLKKLNELLETTWKQARNETFKVHEMEQSY